MLDFILELCRESVAGGFWHFAGYWFMVAVIITVPIQGIVKLMMFLVNRPLRHKTLRKLGYPPPHCDADGDFKKIKKKDQ